LDKVPFKKGKKHQMYKKNLSMKILEKREEQKTRKYHEDGTWIQLAASHDS
jgi:hypothetical protein